MFNGIKPGGDNLVCMRWAGNEAVYENIRIDYKTRCDIRAEVQPGRLTTIGRNVSDSVSDIAININAQGQIIEPRYYAVVRVGA